MKNLLLFNINENDIPKGSLEVGIYVNKILPENPAAERVSQNIFPLQLFLFR